MASSNPYQNYKEQSILTMTSGELLLVLYDECIKSLNFAVYYIDEENKPEECEKLIKKTQRIIHYLDGILDYKYEISMNLHMLYDYFIRTLVKANVRKKSEVLKPLIPLIEELRNAFAQADKNIRIK